MLLQRLQVVDLRGRVARCLQRLRRQLAARTPPPAADALLCTALALGWNPDEAPYEGFTLVNQAVQAAAMFDELDRSVQSGDVERSAKIFSDLQARYPAAQWTAQGGLRLRPDYWADKGGMDGFFMVRLRKA